MFRVAFQLGVRLCLGVGLIVMVRDGVMFRSRAKCCS